MTSSLIENSLAKFGLFRTSDIDDGHSKIADVAGPHRVGIISDSRLLDINVTGFNIDAIPLLSAHYGAEVNISSEQSDYYFAQTTLAGNTVVSHSKEEYVTAAGNTAIVSPYVPYKIRLSTDCHRVLIGVKHSALKEHLSKLINDDVNDELVFDLKVSNEVAWRNTVSYIAKQISDTPHALKSEGIQKIYSDLIKSTLLELHNHNYIQKINAKEDRMMCPQIKSAVDYIYDNIKEVVTATDLAEYSKVSLRTLQRNFLKHMDMTPTKFIRNAKLNAIHKELKSTRSVEVGTIKRILLDYNIYDFGRFANYYRLKFGATPQETLLSARL